MRFLADECCDFAAVRSLRAQGHDVLAVSEFQQRSVDQGVMSLALAEEGVLLTKDDCPGRLRVPLVRPLASRPGGRLRARAPAPHGLSGRRRPRNHFEPHRRRPTLYYYFNDL